MYPNHINIKFILQKNLTLKSGKNFLLRVLNGLTNSTLFVTMKLNCKMEYSKKLDETDSSLLR